jgi:arginine decarboxylase
MLTPTTGPLRPRVLVVDDELAKLETALGRAVESLAAALETRNIDVLKAISFEDGQAIVVSDASLRAVLLDWNLGKNSEGSHAQATALLHKFRERHETAPVFLIADRERTRGTLTVEVAEMVDEFVWPLEDSADFVAGRVMAAIRRYEAQLLSPYARMLAEYARLREHSWSAPGHSTALDLGGRSIGVQLNPGNPNLRLLDFIEARRGRSRSSTSLCLCL